MKDKGKGFVVKDMKTQHIYVVRDYWQVSELIGVTVVGIRRWFHDDVKSHIYKGWMVTKGVESSLLEELKVKFR